MDLQKELQKVDELRAKLIAEIKEKDHITALEEAQPMVKYGTEAHERLLETGYGMTIAEAKTIIKERDEQPERWPLEEARKAQAMIAAYQAKPTVLSTRQPWRTRHRSRSTTAR
jgi:hypothetical protein